MNFVWKSWVFGIVVVIVSVVVAAVVVEVEGDMLSAVKAKAVVEEEDR